MFSPRTLQAATIAGAAFFLLCGYEFVRSPSNTLFQQAYGTKNLPLAMTLIPLLAGALVLAYHFLLRKLGPRRSLMATTLASALVLAGCTWGIRAGYDPLRVVLFVFRESYVVLLIEQYWSFVNSTFDENFAKRFNGLFTGIGTLGAILGDLAVGGLSESLGTVAMPLFAAALLAPAAYFSHLAYAKQPSRPDAKKEDVGGVPSVAEATLFNERRLLWTLFFLITSTQVISTVLGLSFQTHLQQEIPAVDSQTAFSGKFYALLNSTSLVLQFAAAPILLKRVPVRLVHLGIPLTHSVAALWLLVHPSLFSAGLAFLLFKAFDYSLFRVTKEMLYIPLSFNGRYRAKQDIDVMGYRFSKGGSSAMVAALQRAGISSLALYPAAALAAAAAWVGLLLPLFWSRKKELVA